MAYYLTLKYLHVTCVLLTFCSFALRGLWMLRASPLLQRRWARTLPHVIDTLLLLSGLGLAVLLQQYPFVHGWLTAKFFALIAYIVLGSLALKHGRSRGARAAAFAGALGVFAYLFFTALNRTPAPLLWQRFFF